MANRTLRLHAHRLAVPTYDRSRLRPAVVHMGVGGFHRAHQAVYFDALADRGITSDWGLVGVNLRRRAMKDALAPQDGLYTVVQRSRHGDQARVVGATTRHLFAPEEPGAVLATLTDARTSVVTLTITGDGYNIDPESGRFDGDHPDVAADLRRPDRPLTVAGFLVEALARRRRAGGAPFTVLSCDNLPCNGAVAREAVVFFADMRDPVLARWIERNVAFPSTVVDRITPETTSADRRLVARRFGVRDHWPVLTEPFSQWVVEDAFATSRPPLDAVGVQFVADVRPFKLAKNRLLNASHSALAYLGVLVGHRTTDQAVRDAVLRAYIRRLMAEEIRPLLPAVPGMDLAGYERTLLRRLANPRIRDQLERLCRRGSTKMPAYVLPSLADALQRGAPHDLLALAVAGWLRYLRGVDEAGRPIEIDDPRGSRLRALATAGGPDPRPLLGERPVFGDLGDNPAAVAAIERALAALAARGVHAAVAGALRDELEVAL